MAIYHAIRSGRLIRPNRCQRCGRRCKPEGHHPDYRKKLEVVWLCRPCHLAERGYKARVLIKGDPGHVDRSTPVVYNPVIMPRMRAPIQTDTITIRCYADEKKAVRKAAKTLKISLAEFIRTTLIARAKRLEK